MTRFEDARARWGPELERRLSAAVQGEGLIFDAARYHLATGGKRLRALLPPWLCGNLGGDPAAALDVGIAIELVHNGTLVHDDLQDGDTQRRGLPTVWSRYGMPQAVNVGTALLLLGIAQVLKSPLGGRLIADINLAILRVVEGQAREFELNADAQPTTAKWERMARGKTGALFGACFLAGARAAGKSDEECDAFFALGAELGVFFQLQDDLLDLVGDKGREAKGARDPAMLTAAAAPTATDLAEGKVSWPVAWLAGNGSAADCERLMAIVRAPRQETSAAMIAHALTLLRRSGAIQAAVTEVRRMAEALGGSPLAYAIPGLIEVVLAPVRHALDA